MRKADVGVSLVFSAPFFSKEDNICFGGAKLPTRFDRFFDSGEMRVKGCCGVARVAFRAVSATAFLWPLYSLLLPVGLSGFGDLGQLRGILELIVERKLAHVPYGVCPLSLGRAFDN